MLMCLQSVTVDVITLLKSLLIKNRFYYVILKVCLILKKITRHMIYKNTVRYAVSNCGTFRYQFV